MTSTRDNMVAALGAIAPASVAVVKYARNIDPPTKPTVLVRLDELEPAPSGGLGHRITTFALIVIPTKTDPGPADDELDDVLDVVLDAIDAADGIAWQRAVRGSYQDTKYPAYEVTVRVLATPTTTTQE